MTSNGLVFSFRTQCDPVGELEELNRAVELGREALSLCPQRRPDRSIFLIKLSSYLSARYRRNGEINNITEAIVLAKDALLLCAPGHRHRAVALNTLAFSLCARYENSGEIEDLDEAINITRDALSACTSDNSHRRMHLKNLASYICTRYNRLDELSRLNKAIMLEEGALSAFSPKHPDRPGSSDGLMSFLFNWHDQLKGLEDLNKTIALSRKVLSLRRPQLLGRLGPLNDLANNLSSRYQQLGGMDDLNEAIVLVRESLSLLPHGHPDQSGSLNNLAKYLSSRYQQLGWMDDLNEAIVLAREALSLRPPGHPDRSGSLNDLANHLSSQYQQLGGMDDLNEAIALAREALSFRPPGHPDRSGSLNDLAKYLSFRYHQLSGIDDLNEAIVLAREALLLHPPGHPDRSGSLGNLANIISSRYRQLREIDDLDEAIVLAREALSFRPPGHPDRSGSLNDLANILSSRYQRLGGIDVLNEAIALVREALSRRPQGHPDRSGSLNDLANNLSSRYQQLGGIDDLNEAIVLAREALSLRSLEHPLYSVNLKNLADHLYSRYNQLEGIGNHNAMQDKQELFSLYTRLQLVSQTASSTNLSAAKAWINTAEKFTHPTTLLAYETCLRFLVQHLAVLPSLPHHLGVLKSLSSSLAVDAFSACLRNQSPIKAVELLEQGRALSWSQLTRLRSPLDYVIESGPQGKALADEFTRLSSLIRYTLDSPGPDQHDRVCHLNLELQKVVSKIRELPGLSRFLLPLLFMDLQTAAKDGPVIIMNASKYGCDALVVFSDRDPVHIPLPVTKSDVQDLSSRLRTLTKDATRMNTENEFKLFLRELWDKLVFHVVNVLWTTCPLNSRIWWCPTAEFSLLPLHAATPYREGEKGVSGLYVSSYTTTLTTLIRARRASLPASLHWKPRFVVIGQATAKDGGELPGVGRELNGIDRVVHDFAVLTRVEGEDCCISTVADKLGKNDWAHLACSGIQNQNMPFESALALHDGEFTIEHICRCDFQSAEFAYLSADHTAVGDKENLDEAIHLVAALQFAGFRSVIGTMWAVADSHAIRVASTFYELMVDDSGRLDYTRAAQALRVTMRKVDIPMHQRIFYQHFGV